MPSRHKERHPIKSIGWLRAAVLGANDGIVSTSSLVLGVAAAHATHGSILIAGVAGLVAGAMSMATGEYVSGHSQADTERAALGTKSARNSKPTSRASIENLRRSTLVAVWMHPLQKQWRSNSWPTMR